jgi:hypothetical protein
MAVNSVTGGGWGQVASPGPLSLQGAKEKKNFSFSPFAARAAGGFQRNPKTAAENLS